MSTTLLKHLAVLTCPIALCVNFPALSQEHPGAATRLYQGIKDTDMLGFHVITCGDLNGDGYSEYIVGAPGHNIFSGRARVYSGIDGAMMHELREYSVSFFGFSIASIGDADGDGVNDIVVGAPLDFANNQPTGSATLFSGATGEEIVKVWGDSLLSVFGWAVVGAGDVDGDGFADFAVAAPDADTYLGEYSGSVTTYSGANGSVLRHYNGVIAGGRFGQSLANLGDIDGDGFDELAIGIPSISMVAIYSPRYNILTKFYKQPIPGFGTALASVGDLTGDGRSELIVGARQASKAFIYDVAAQSLLSTLHGAKDSWFGYSVAGAGDVDGDGTPDIIVGSPQFGPYSRGRVDVFSGATGFPLRIINGGATSAAFGHSVSSAGDVNNDGLDDILVGDPVAYKQIQCGAAYLFLSNELQLELASANHYILSGAEPVAMLPMRVDSDIYFDLVSVTRNRIQLRFHNGDGMFAPAQTFVTAVNTGATPIDVNRDGRMDLMTTNAKGFTYYRNRGYQQGFVQDSSISISGRPVSPVFVDFNNDTLPDLAVALETTNQVRIFRNHTQRKATFSGQFYPTQTINVGVQPIQVVSAKVNNDPHPDLLVLNKGSNSVSVLINNGNGVFIQWPDVPITGTALQIAAADFNRDGRMDLAVLTTHSVIIRDGIPLGKFGAERIVAAGAGARSMIAVDMDRDYFFDLVFAHYSASKVSVMVNDKAGGFYPRQEKAVGSLPTTLAIGDMDNDRDFEIITGNRGNNTISIVPNLFIK